MDPEMIMELVNGLCAIFGKNVRRIILYGSAARREETAESDIDIAIIMRHGFESETRKKFIAWAAEMDLKYEKVFSIIDIEEKNIEKWGSVLPFYRNIREEGIVLWKAA